MTARPPLRPLHGDATLSRAKIAFFERWTIEALVGSLAPGQEHSLKVQADGTMMDGHHRILVLRSRDILVDDLSREIWRTSER